MKIAMNLSMSIANVIIDIKPRSVSLALLASPLLSLRVDRRRDFVSILIDQHVVLARPNKLRTLFGRKSRLAHTASTSMLPLVFGHCIALVMAIVSSVVQTVE